MRRILQMMKVLNDQLNFANLRKAETLPKPMIAFSFNQADATK